MAVHQYRVGPDGAVSEAPILIAFPDGAGPGVPDGMKVDSAGNIFQLVANGSFETPVVPVGSFSNFLTGSTAITGWTVFGPAVSVVSGSFTSGALSFPAQDGVQWLDLTGPTSGPSEGVNQTVTTTAGQTYNLSFYVGNIVGGGFGIGNERRNEQAE